MRNRNDRIAEQLARAIAREYGVPQNEGPTVYPAEHECLSGEARAISWEGHGPYDWPYLYTQTESAKELARTYELFLEPINGVSLAVYFEEGKE